MNRLWFVIFGLTAIIVFIILFDKDPPSVDLAPYERAIAILEVEKQEEQALFKEIVQKSNTRIKKDSITINAKDKRIAALEKRAVQERTPRVDTLIKSDPQLESFVNTQSEIIGELKEEVDTLKASVEFHIQVNKDLVRSSEDIQATFEQQLTHTQALADAYKKDARKSKRANRWLKAGAVVIGVGGLFLGAQL